jgi:hypothetical protein
MSVADELGWVRAEISRLKTREGSLREVLIAEADTREGLAFAVTVRQQKRRVFQKSRLPASILDDPAYWQTKSSPVVVVTPRFARGETRRQEDEDFEVFERF